MWSIARLLRSRRGWLAALLGAMVVTIVAARPARGQLEPLLVRGVHFQGNHGVDPLFLAASIATTQSSLFARSPLLRWLGLGDKRYFNQREFITDVYRLQVVFKRSGY